jgi:hypothetical protein
MSTFYGFIGPLLFGPFEVEGLENLPKNRNELCIYVSNHQSRLTKLTCLLCLERNAAAEEHEDRVRIYFTHCCMCVHSCNAFKTHLTARCLEVTPWVMTDFASFFLIHTSTPSLLNTLGW